jgi:hypothetical protein
MKFCLSASLLTIRGNAALSGGGGVKRPALGAENPNISSPGSNMSVAVPLPTFCACLARNGTALAVLYLPSVSAWHVTGQP